MKQTAHSKSARDNFFIAIYMRGKTVYVKKDVQLHFTALPIKWRVPNTGYCV